MYREVAEHPEQEFHFETGRPLAERLGYPSAELDAIPSETVDSFAGVGYYFDLAELNAGETVVDLGSGSGTDSFLAAGQVGDESCASAGAKLRKWEHSTRGVGALREELDPFF